MTPGVALTCPATRHGRRPASRCVALVFAVGVLMPVSARADWQITPYLAVAFGGDTNIIKLGLDPGGAVKKRHNGFGVSAGWISSGWFGVEGDLAFAPAFFGDRSETVATSRLTSLSGNIVVLVPRRVVGDSLRPYATGGLGLVRAAVSFDSDALEPLARNLMGFNVGGGVTGFLTDRAGVRWDLRYFRGTSGDDDLSVTGGTGTPTLSYWRLSMGVVLRY